MPDSNIFSLLANPVQVLSCAVSSCFSATDTSKLQPPVLESIKYVHAQEAAYRMIAE